MSETIAAANRNADILQVLNGIPHGVAVLDKDLKILEMNWFLETLTGYKAEEVRGIYYDFVIHGSLGAKGRSLFLQVIDNDESVSTEGDIINATRKKIPVRFTVSSYNAPPHLPAGIMLFMEDISLQNELEQKRRGADKATGIIGHSQKLQEIMELLPVLAHTDSSVLITGETGTGKDLLAEAIHTASKRSNYPFIKINCGALPETLLESELFGYVRGAFTGAHSDKPGMFRMAQGGTLFLTEIGDLPLSLQVKLLTVLDDMEFYPIGSSKKVKVDARLIAGTHRDLRQLVREGRFREDLYFRLNVLRAHIPPLRERGEDTLLLMDHFLQYFAGSLGKNIKGYSKEAISCLMRYTYPGNVRELRNIVEYAVNMCQGEKVSIDHLPSYVHFTQSYTPFAEEATACSAMAANGTSSSVENTGQVVAASWSAIEKNKILEALMKTGGHRGKASKVLGWGRSTLWRKIKQYGLE